VRRTGPPRQAAQGAVNLMPVNGDDAVEQNPPTRQPAHREATSAAEIEERDLVTGSGASPTSANAQLLPSREPDRAKLFAAVRRLASGRAEQAPAPLSSRGLGRRPLTAETRVRIPVAVLRKPRNHGAFVVLGDTLGDSARQPPWASAPASRAVGQPSGPHKRPVQWPGGLRFCDGRTPAGSAWPSRHNRPLGNAALGAPQARSAQPVG